MERSESYSFESEHRPAELLRRIGRVAEQWDGEWEPASSEAAADEKEAAGETENVAENAGRLGLPVTAGLRRGWLAGELEIEARGRGSRVHFAFAVDRGELKAERGSVLVLLVGAFGGLVTIIAPFFPVLWPLVPIGLLLGFSAWFMVVARLRTAGPREFFDQVEDA